jgi:hypothetical protein
LAKSAPANPGVRVAIADLTSLEQCGKFKAFVHLIHCLKAAPSFAQQMFIGVDRWFILCLMSFIPAHWVYLSTSPTELPDWAKTANLALQLLLPEVLVCLLLIQVEHSQHLLQSFSLDLQLVEVKT